MTTDIVLDQPKPEVVDVTATIEIVRQVAVLSTEEDYVSVATAWTAIREKADAIAAWFKPRKAKAREVYEQMLTDERTLTKPLDDALIHAKRLMTDYVTEKKRREVVEAAKAHVVAVQEQSEKVIQEAVELAEAGAALNDPEMQFQAHEMIERASRPGGMAVPARRAPVAPVVAGMRTKEVWNPSMDEKAKALAFAAEHPEYFDLFDMNPARAKELANFYKGRLSTVIPGMSASCETVPVKAPRK